MSDNDVNDCDHPEYDVDILTGLALCACGHAWWLTNEELEREIERQVEDDAYYYEMNRRESSPLWRAWWWVLRAWRRVTERPRRGPFPAEFDGELPF